MNKSFFTITFILIFISAYLIFTKEDLHKVTKIISPIEYKIDLNNDLVEDENNTIKLMQINYINNNTDYSNDTLFKNLSEEKIFFANYFANQIANNYLHNNYVKIKKNKIFFKNQDYEELLVKSKFFYKNNENEKEKFYNFLQSVNTNDYVIYNTKSQKYHLLNCEYGKSSKNSIIIKKDKLNNNAKPCGYCFIKRKEKENKKPIYAQKINNFFRKENIKIYFLDLNKIFIPQKNCSSLACKALKEKIDSSEKSIDFAIYGIEGQPQIINALINAQKRGVKIRWVFDYDYKNTNYYKDTEKLKQFLPDFKSDVSENNSGYNAIMHNKFFIFDNKCIWTGSTNITDTGLSEFNANLAVLINSPTVAQIYTNEFNQMYTGNFHTNKKHSDTKTIKINNSTTVKPLFSPQDDIINSHLIPLINNSKKSIYIPIFFITSKEIQNSLINAHNRGIDIKIINDATNAQNKYSIHKKLRENGIKVKTENYAGKMHIKALIIDDEISVIGSMNLSKNGANKNDENMLLIKDKEVNQYLKKIFLYLWNKIPDKYLHTDPNPESFESIGSCSDGIDNDFDGKIDKEDELCRFR